MVDLSSIDPTENRRRMAAGELYYCFTPDLTEARWKASAAVRAYNASEAGPRRERVELLKTLFYDNSPSPPVNPDPMADAGLFSDYAWIDGPITKVDYGWNVKLGPNVYINSNSTWIDTLPISIGARTLVGPNCAFYSGSHPLDPFVRNGTSGPEAGAPVSIGEDCWLGGNVVVLPGVTIGRGTTIGAGSVVTRDIPEFVVAVGNPARVIRKLDVKEPADWAHSRKGSGGQDQGVGGGVPEAGDAKVPLPVAGGRSVQVLEGEKIVEAS